MSDSREEVTRAAYLAGWRAGASVAAYVGQTTQHEAKAYDDGYESGRRTYREVHRMGADPVVAAVATERARCLAIVAEVETRRYRGAAINACRDIADAIKARS